MKKLIEVNIPLYLPNWPRDTYVQIPVVGINQMYATWHANGKRGKRLTKEAIFYKSHLQKYIRQALKESSLETHIEWNVFYTIDVTLCVPYSKSWEPKKSYYRDLDGLLKPIQDEMSSDEKNLDYRIWKDDKQVFSFLANLSYTDKIEEGNIVITVYDYDPLQFKALVKSLSDE